MINNYATTDRLAPHKSGEPHGEDNPIQVTDDVELDFKIGEPVCPKNPLPVSTDAGESFNAGEPISKNNRLPVSLEGVEAVIGEPVTKFNRIILHSVSGLALSIGSGAVFGDGFSFAADFAGDRYRVGDATGTDATGLRGPDIALASSYVVDDSTVVQNIALPSVAGTYEVLFTLTGATTDKRVRLQSINPADTRGFKTADGDYVETFENLTASSTIRISEGFMDGETGSVTVSNISVRRVFTQATVTGTRLVPSFTGLVEFTTNQAAITDLGYYAHGAATNIVPDSSDFSAGSWIRSGVTVSANQDAGPMGDNTADKVIPSNGTGVWGVVRIASLAATGKAHAAAVFKAAGHEYGVLTLAGNGLGYRYGMVFSLVDGSVTQVLSGGSVANGRQGVVDLGGGYFLAWAEADVASSGNGYVLAASSANSTGSVDANGNVSVTGNGTDGAFVWGAQLCNSVWQGVLTPTSGATASISASELPTDLDAALVDENMTVFAEFDMQTTPAANGSFLTVNDGTSTNRADVVWTGSQIALVVVNAGSAAFIYPNVLAVEGKNLKIAGRYLSGEWDCLVWVDGVLSQSPKNAAIGLPTGMDQVSPGSSLFADRQIRETIKKSGVIVGEFNTDEKILAAIDAWQSPVPFAIPSDYLFGSNFAEDLYRVRSKTSDKAYNFPGPELVTNGTFDTDLTDWVEQVGTTTQAAGGARISPSSQFDYRKSVSGITGKTFVVTWDQTVNTGSRLRLRLRGFSVGADIGGFLYHNGSGSQSATFTAVDDGFQLWFITEASDDVTIDNVSVREFSNTEVSVTGTRLVPSSTGLVEFGSNEPAITDLGYYAHGAATNSLAYSEDLTEATAVLDATATASTVTTTTQTGIQTPLVGDNAALSTGQHTFFADITDVENLGFIALRTANFDAGANGTSFFNWSTMAVETEAPEHIASIEEIEPGVWRLAITFTLGGSDNSGRVDVCLSDVDGIVRVIDPAGDESATIIRRQVNAGSNKVVYIPTSGATASISASEMTTDLDAALVDEDMLIFAEGTDQNGDVSGRPTLFSLAGAGVDLIALRLDTLRRWNCVVFVSGTPVYGPTDLTVQTIGSRARPFLLRLSGQWRFGVIESDAVRWIAAAETDPIPNGLDEAKTGMYFNNGAHWSGPITKPGIISGTFDTDEKILAAIDNI